MTNGIYGSGSGYPGYWMNLYFQKASESSERLASGKRVNGKSGAADLAAYDLQRASASAAEIEARSSAYFATQAFADARRVDAAALLVSRASEAGVSAAEKTALEAQAQVILDEVTSFSSTVATVFDDLGKIAGIASALEAKSFAQSAAAAFNKEAAESFIAVDFGKETSDLARYQVLQQAASAMVAQINQSRAVILSLLK